MTEAEALALGREALAVALALAGPVLAVSLGVGVVLGILQAMFQVQEPTLTFAPKIILLAALAFWAGPVALHVAVEFTRRAFHGAGLG